MALSKCLVVKGTVRRIEEEARWCEGLESCVKEWKGWESGKVLGGPRGLLVMSEACS